MNLAEVPYISHVPRDGRVLLLQPWFDSATGTWHMYVEATPGDYIRLQVVGFSAGLYYASAPASSDDLDIPLANLVAQHLSFRPVGYALYCLVDDLNMLSASLKKIDIFGQEDIETASFLIESELEYQFSLVRAMYDLLQKIAKEITSLLHTQDGKVPVAALPGSFAAVALSGDRPRTEEELREKYSLPTPLVTFYCAHSRVFRQLRAIRVAIEHHGKRVPSVFKTEQGFGISTEGLPEWSALEVWKQHSILPNNIGSVKALSSFLAQTFLRACNDFEDALRKVIAPDLMPSAVSSGNRVFFTNPLVGYLSGLEVTGVLASHKNASTIY